jgi:thioredoxin 1
MVGDTTYVTLTEGSFHREVLQSTEPVLVDFWADWCGPCHRIAPTIEELATEFAGRAKVGKLNVDQHTPVAAQFGIRSIPTLLFFKDGQIVDQVIGAAPKRVLADKLDALLQTASGDKGKTHDTL